MSQLAPTTVAPKPELGTMRALTLWRPWPWTIVHEPTRPKRIENRPWPCPSKFIGEVIALHAGRKWDKKRERFILEALGLDEFPEAARHEGIIGTARVVGQVQSIDEVAPGQRVWFFGPYGWILEDVRALAEPIPIRGAQGLWRVPLSVQARIERETAGLRLAYENGDVRLYQGEAKQIGEVLEPESVDALVCDPPSGIGFMGKDWDSDKGGRDNWIAWLAEQLRAAFVVMKPGAHGLVWAIPRTSHWTGMAIEAAGFEIRDRVSHLFGNGFPKSLNISKAIDKRLGAKREIIGRRHDAAKLSKLGNDAPGGWKTPPRDPNLTAPGSPEAAAWEGWGTALKPACEDWWLIRKPFSGPLVANVLERGTGGLNVEACRVSTSGEAFSVPQSNPGNRSHDQAVQPGAGSSVEKKRAAQRESIQRTAELGRWPAHVVLDETAAAILDEQAGESVSRKDQRPKGTRPGGFYDVGSDVGNAGSCGPTYDDRGGPSRFFYCPKPARSEKDAGLAEAGIEAKSGGEATGRQDGSAGTQNPRAGAGRTGGARNSHPTVKSTALMRWLIRLITPPGGLVLDPFSGSGTTGVAAIEEGVRFIGCELAEGHPEYIEIASARLAEAAEAAAIAADPWHSGKRDDPRQVEMFAGMEAE